MAKISFTQRRWGSESVMVSSWVCGTQTRSVGSLPRYIVTRLSGSFKTAARLVPEE
jgi:hypothetical protein